MDQSPGEMYAIAIVFSIIPIVAVILRYHVRWHYKQGFGPDDWLMIPALVSALGTSVAMIYAVAQGGLGTHTSIKPDGSPNYTNSTENYLKASYVTLLTQVVTFGCTKLSVLYFYKRLFRGRIFKVCLWTLIVLVIGWTISFFFVSLLECLPIESNWSGNGINANCIDEFPMYRSHSWTDMILDIAILILPIPMIWRLQLSTRRKWAISGIFLLGILTVLASIARLISQYTIQSEFASQDGADITWILAPTFYWVVIESALGILAACLVTIRPLFIDSGSALNSLLRSWRGHKSDTSGGQSSPSKPYHSMRGRFSSWRHGEDTTNSSSSTKGFHNEEYARQGQLDEQKGGIRVERKYEVV